MRRIVALHNDLRSFEQGQKDKQDG